MAKDRVGLATAEHAEDWLAILDDQGAEFLLLDADKDASLLQEIEGHHGWVIELRDGESVFLCRTQAYAGSRVAPEQ